VKIWVSALSTSFQARLERVAQTLSSTKKTGEDLRAVMSRVISEQLGAQVTL